MITEIKAIALDIYGTVLASDDHDNCFPPRNGLEKFFDHCDEMRVAIFSTSDAKIASVKCNLRCCFLRFEENFGPHKHSLERFSGFYQLNQQPYKDFGILLRHWKLSPSQLLVIGDSSKDIDGARSLGCPYIHVPEYTIDGEREFDFSSIRLDELYPLS